MRRASKISFSLVVAILVALILFRAVLPSVIRSYVNRNLARIPGYQGEIGRVTLSLYKGGYTIHDLNIVKLDGKVPVPLFKAEIAELSLQWRELWNGALVGELFLYSPQLNFVIGKTEQTSQTKVDRSWQDVVKSLFPLRFNHVRITNGEIHYRDFAKDPKIDVHLDHIEARAENLTNSKRISTSLVAEIDASGKAQAQALVSLKVGLNPFAQKPDFSLKFVIQKLDLTRLNDFLKGYAGFDVTSGTLELYSELESKQGRFSGYVKPLIKDVNAFDLKGQKSLGGKLWQGFMALVVEIFENPSKDQIGSKVPISGTFDDPEPELFSAVGSLLYNAFVEALKPGLEESVKNEKVSEKNLD